MTYFTYDAYVAGGQTKSTSLCALLLFPGRHLQRLSKPSKPRLLEALQGTINAFKIWRGWCITSMTSCFITSWLPCVVRTVWTAWLRLVSKHLIFLLESESTGALLFHFITAQLAYDISWQIFAENIVPYLRLVVFCHVIRVCWQNTRPGAAEVSPVDRRRSRVPTGHQHSRVRSYFTYLTYFTYYVIRIF